MLLYIYILLTYYFSFKIMEENVETSSGGPILLNPEDYTRRLSELRKKTNNPLFKNKLIHDLSKLSDMKKFLDSKDIKFETLSEFTHIYFF